MRTSVMQSVVVGLNLRTCDAVYSDTRRNPWNAISMAAHSIALSFRLLVEFQRLCPSWVSSVGVIGIRGGFFDCEP